MSTSPMSKSPGAKPATTPQIFTANRLIDGRVVWLAADGAWVEAVADAAIFPPDQAAAGLALAQQGERDQQVIGGYGVEVAATPGTPRPLKLRERLRIDGPSIAAEPPGWRLAS